MQISTLDSRGCILLKVDNVPYDVISSASRINIKPLYLGKYQAYLSEGRGNRLSDFLPSVVLTFATKFS